MTALLVIAAACSRGETPLDPVAPPPPGLPPPSADYIVTDMGIVLGANVVMNNSGVVAGGLWPLQPFIWHNGVLTLLPALGEEAAVTAIGPSGVIGGTSFTPAGRRITVWENGVMREIGPDSGGAELAQVLAINSRGDILAQTSYSFSRDGHAIIWRGGERHAIGHLSPREDTHATALNNLGQVTGFSVIGTDAVSGIRPFLWTDGILTDLGTLGGTFAYGIDINDRGEVVGISADSSGGTRPFIWRNGVIRDLGAFPLENVLAVRINNGGQVLGVTQPLEGFERPFLWKDGVVTLIGTLGGALTIVLDINDRGQVVGFSKTREGLNHAFVWHEGTMTDLGAGMLDQSAAVAINERGDIVGFTGTVDRQVRGVFWRRR